MLSRILAFGFVSSVYRIATVAAAPDRRLHRRLPAAGRLVAAGSRGCARWAIFAIFFADTMPATAFAIVIVAEALLWRPAELVIIVNNGMGRFGRASMLAIIGDGVRAAAAVAFVAMPAGGLAGWTMLYLAANAGVADRRRPVLSIPGKGCVLKTDLYFKRLPDALYVAGAEMLFYLQMELDKLLVLALGGAQLAGIYAIVMRLVDLTAIPIRAFTMMLVQKMMRAPEILARLGVRAGIEGAIFAVSTLALVTPGDIAAFLPGRAWPQRRRSRAAGRAGDRRAGTAQPGRIPGRAAVRARPDADPRAQSRPAGRVEGGAVDLCADRRSSTRPNLVLSLNVVFLLLYLASALLTYSRDAHSRRRRSGRSRPQCVHHPTPDAGRRMRPISVPMKDCMPIATCSGDMVAATKARNSSSESGLAGPVHAAEFLGAVEMAGAPMHIVDDSGRRSCIRRICVPRRCLDPVPAMDLFDLPHIASTAAAARQSASKCSRGATGSEAIDAKRRAGIARPDLLRRDLARQHSRRRGGTAAPCRRARRRADRTA